MLRKPLKWHDLAFFSAEKYEIFRKMVSESELWIADDVMFEIDLENSAGTRCVPLKDGGAALKVCVQESHNAMRTVNGDSSIVGFRMSDYHFACNQLFHWRDGTLYAFGLLIVDHGHFNVEPGNITQLNQL